MNKKKDYQYEFEEHRKEIDIDNDDYTDELPSRTELHGKKRRSTGGRSSHTLINTILAVFTLIPVLIFSYVIYNFYNGKDDSNSAQIEHPGVEVEVESAEPETVDAAIVDDEKDQKGSDGSVNGSKSKAEGKKETDSALKDTKQTASADSGQAKGDKTPANQAAAQPPKKTEAVQTKPESKPQSKPQPKPQPKPQVKPEQNKQPSANQGQKSHIVKQDETLYRISVNYYGSDIGVEKIKRANGLSSNEIRVGQKLIIP